MISAPTNRNWRYFDTVPVIDSTIHFLETCTYVDFMSLPTHKRDQVDRAKDRDVRKR